MELNNLNQTASKEAIMAVAAQTEMHFYEMYELYDLAEALVDPEMGEFIDNPDQQLAIVEPLADEICEAADVLTEEFQTIAETKKARQSNSRIEGALRRIYMAIDAYHQRAEAAAEGMTSGFRNIADPIVNKIVRQLEAIVAILIDYVELSLDRIMSHSYAEALRKRQEKIAMMLHSIGQGAT